MERYVPVRCGVCEACWYDRNLGRCLYLGPYKGYRRLSDGSLEGIDA